MTWNIYEFLDNRGDGVIESWLRQERIQKPAIALLEQKLRLLETAGGELPPGLLAYLGGFTYKLKVRAQGVQLRPMLCKGPIDMETEFTLLIGAIERGGRLSPINAQDRAEQNRRIILADPQRRRIYEL
jgi:hypothetical protein